MDHSSCARKGNQPHRHCSGVWLWSIRGDCWQSIQQWGRREQVIIATKVGLDWHDGVVFRNATRRRISQEIEDSLRRLKTSYIDLYQVHWPDPLVSCQETAEAMGNLLEQGKIRAIGVSNYLPPQMDAFRAIAPLHSDQPPYNLFEREIEMEVLPYTLRNHIATLTYGALCRGLLSGKMRPNSEFKGDDLRKSDPKFRSLRYAQYLKAVEQLDRFAQENYGKQVIHLALRWLLDRAGVGIALWGGRHPEQMMAIDGVFGWSLSQEAMKKIDEILRATTTDSVGPEFMAPPVREILQEV